MICYQGEEVQVDGKGSPNLYSIGVALGRIPRFCGHTRECYPVLGHVLTVAAILPDTAALPGLLHDAPEACMSDVPTPWKTEAARRRERVLLRRIYATNGLDYPISIEAQEAVDVADHVVLIAEAHALGHAGGEEAWGDEYDETAYELTQYHLSNADSYRNAEIAGPIFEQAFAHYNELYQATLTKESVEA